MPSQKKAKTSPTIPAASPTTPLWKKPWIWLFGGVGALAVLLTNVNTMLSSARALPGEVQKTSDQFFEWYGDYQAWKGHWTNFPEGIADMTEMNLSNENFRINVDDTKDGYLAGTIETQGICDKIAYFDEFMIEGTIRSSRSADVTVWDLVGGYKREFARIELEREADLMIVKSIVDPMGIFAKETRIARDPDEFKGEDDRQPICGDKQAKFIKDALKQVSEKPSEPMKR